MSEGLNVPEEHLEDVIKVIKAGLKTVTVPKAVRTNLEIWCRDEEIYLKELQEDEEEVKPKKKKK